MSEFTYACPVCHQHLKCHVTKGGSVVKCPTCFQRLVTPQTPADLSSTLVISASRYVERHTSSLPTTIVAQTPNNSPPSSPRPKAAPVAVIVTVVLILAALGGAFAVRFFMADQTLKAAKAAAPKAASWQTMDVGNIAPPGTFKQTQGVITLSGAGADIWRAADEFFYAFQPVSGDCTLTAHLLSMDNVDSCTKAGLMIRESGTPDAKHATLCIMPSTGVYYQERENHHKEIAMTKNHSAKWLRLTRQGNSFTAYCSEDGVTWSQVGSTTIDLPAQALAGLIVCSHKSGVLCEAKFDQVALKSGH